MTAISPENIKLLLVFQKNESSEHLIYQKLSLLEKKEINRQTLGKISADELKHYNIWKSYTGEEIPPDKIKVWWYLLLAKIFGITFSIKLMESGEKGAQKTYSGLLGSIPEAGKIILDENGHEKGLVAMLDEERLKYMGSVVLGLNDALVELTGTLAGLTFALQNAKIVGVAGLITGIAASLSMAASEYLSTKTEAGEKNPMRASIYTGITYVLAVAVLIAPFLILSNQYISLFLAFLSAVVMIWLFTFYCSVVAEVPFKKRFSEMLMISMGVAFLSFIIGLAARWLLGVSL